MSFWLIKHRHAQPPKDISGEIIDKALERYRVQAQEQVRQFLCTDCLDQRCRTGPVCNAFCALTDSIAWEMSAGRAEMN